MAFRTNELIFIFKSVLKYYSFWHLSSNVFQTHHRQIVILNFFPLSCRVFYCTITHKLSLTKILCQVQKPEKSAKLRVRTCRVTHVCWIWHETCVYFDTNYFSSFSIKYLLDLEGRVDVSLSNDFPLHTYGDQLQYCRG